MAKQNIKKVIRQAGSNISKKEMNQVVKAAGGNVQKAVNRIASVQQNFKAADKPAPVVASGAANMLIKQAQSTPTATDFGSSKLGQTLQGMVGSRASGGYINPQSGQQSFTAAVPSQMMPGGMVIRPGGNLAVKKPEVPKIVPNNTTDTTTTTTDNNTTTTTQANPNQEILDAIAVLQGENQTLRNDLAGQDTYFQDLINQSQMAAQQQMADMSNMFNQQMMGAQDMYNMQIQQANAQALADQEAARAFMINQGRGVMPANLQIGATYGTPQLAGTQGFKRPDRRPTLTPAQTATAFTAPTLAATAAANPMMTQQPTVLNV